MAEKRGACQNKPSLSQWLLNSCSECLCDDITNGLFPKSKYTGKIIKVLFDHVKPNSTLSRWLNDILLIKKDNIKNYQNINTKTIFTQISLKLNINIKIYIVENVNNSKTHCGKSDHPSSCCMVKSEFVSSIVNIQNQHEKRPVFQFIVEANKNYKVYLISSHDALEFNRKVCQTNLMTFSENEMKKYLCQRFTLDNLPEMNFRTNSFENQVYVKIFLAMGFIDGNQLKNNNNIVYYKTWGSNQCVIPGISIIVLGGESELQFIALALEDVNVPVYRSPQYSTGANSKNFKENYPKKIFSEETCPCEYLQVPYKRGSVRKLSKPVGIDETKNDFIHTLKLLSMYNKKERTLILACSRLSISSFDIERYTFLL